MTQKKLLVAGSVSVLLILAVVQFFIYRSIKGQMIDYLNQAQIAQARRATAEIQEYMENSIRTLNLLAEFSEIADLGDRGRRILDNYRRFSPEEIKAVTRVDPNGRIIYTVPDQGFVGRDISNQAHIGQAMETHGVVISDVFTTVQGYRGIAIHVPVFKGVAYNGTLAFLFSFDRIAQRYIESIHVGEGGYAWVVSQNGTILSSPKPGEIGGDAAQVYRDSPELISMVEEMIQGREGVTSYNINRGEDHPKEGVLKQAVYMPIPLRNTRWSIAVATPEDEVTASLAGLRVQLILAAATVMFCYGVLLFALFRVRSSA